MTQKTGTYDIASLQAATNTSAVAFGFDNIAEIIAADNAAFSAVVEDMLAELAMTTKDRLRLVGSSLGGNAMEVDEYGQGPTQKDVPAYFVGIPLKRITFPIGWTTQWLKNAKASDLAVRNGAAQGAHLRRARYELQKAIFTPTNATFLDHLVDKASLAVKAFINADSSAMSNGPNGETFDGSTHTHYDGSATLTAAAITALISDVVEHRNGARVRVYINTTNATAFAALTGFTSLSQPYLTLATSSDRVEAPRQSPNADNRQIGFFGVAEVWTKPWIPANYAVAVDVDAPQKPLLRRVEENDRGLHVAAEIESYPLHANFAEWFYGFGAWNRTALAVLKFDNATYSAPTLTY